MAGEINDQGRTRLDGSSVESATEVLMRPISVAVEIVEPQKNEEMTETRPEPAWTEVPRSETAPVAPATPPDPLAGRVTDVDAARKAFAAMSIDLAGERESQAIRGEYIYSGLGLVFSVLSIVGGAALALHGIADGTSWTARLIGLQTDLRDTGPGVMLVLLGLVLLWTTRPEVRLRDLRPR